MSESRTFEPLTAEWEAELVKIQSELARERPPTPAPPARRSPRPRRRGVSGLVLALVALAIILLVLFGPGIVGSILDRLDYSRSVHQDRSSARHGVRPQLPRTALVISRDADGNTVRSLANADALSAFVRAELERVETARRDTHTRVNAALEARAEPVFDSMRTRVEAFADWYYAWPTSYRLTGKALYSAAANMVKPSVMRLDDAVAYDLERYVEKRYRDIVMRPELSDPLLEWAYVHALETGHGGFLLALQRFDDRFQHFVATQTTYLEQAPDLDQVSVVLDWDHQTKKLSISGMERGTLEVARGVALTAGGALVGRRAGAAVGAKVAQNIGRRAVVAATAVGASGGPLGAVVGGAAGLGLDYAINEGVELAERDSLEAGVRETLELQRRQWQQTMQVSLAEAVDVWFDDLAEMLAAYDSR